MVAHNVVDTVTPNPMLVVAAVIAETIINGSFTGHCAPEITAGSKESL
jgi:hypothetical protein